MIKKLFCENLSSENFLLYNVMVIIPQLWQSTCVCRQSFYRVLACDVTCTTYGAAWTSLYLNIELLAGLRMKLLFKMELTDTR